MNRIFLLIFSLAYTGLSTLAQDPDPKALQETARTFTRHGDYANAIVVLNGALQKDPKSLELLKDLAFDYYLQREYTKGMSIARPLTERDDADVQCYQITAMLYKAIDDSKECEKLYKAGIKRFPQSGPMYNEYGEMLWARQDYSAIRQWEKGIELDPNYSGNYYNACKYYFFTYDRVWSLVYGEIFVNLESYSKRTVEVKDLLLEGYKKLFSATETKKTQTSKSAFALAFLEVMNKQSSAVSRGVTTESLILLRTKFILSWFDLFAARYPFRLFDYQRQLIRDGMFDAYNRWVFGAAESLPDFQTWTNSHSEEYGRFTNFQKGRIFKLPERQYYQQLSK